MTYVYMATDDSNTVFHRRGAVEQPHKARGLANRMAAHGLEVYVGHDIGKSVGKDDIHQNGLGRAYPTTLPNFVLVSMADAPTKNVVYIVEKPRPYWWERLFRR